jgi:hypothetical protein
MLRIQQAYSKACFEECIGNENLISNLNPLYETLELSTLLIYPY